MEKKVLKLPDEKDEVVLKLATAQSFAADEELIDPMKSGLLGPDPEPKSRSLRRIRGVKLYHRVREDTEIYPNAGIFPRLVAMLIDMTFVGVTFVLIYNPVSEMLYSVDAFRIHVPTWLASWVVLTLCIIIYLVFPGREDGVSIGKRALGIKVVSIDNMRLSYPQLIAREVIGKPLGLVFGVGFLLTPFTAQHRAIHDYLAKTRVVRYNYNDPN